MSKDFNTDDITNAFFAPPPKKAGRPPKKEKLRKYRYNLHLDGDLNAFMHYLAWKKHTSITQVVNDLIRKEMEAFLSEGGKIDPFFIEKDNNE